MKDYRWTMRVLIAATAVNLIAMLCMMSTLPDIVPGHFNIRFEVDRMGSKWFLMIFPSIALLVCAGIALEQRIRGRDYANNRPLTIFAGCFAAVFVLLGWMSRALCATGAQLGEAVTAVPFDLAITLGISLLMVVLGNYMPVVQRNRTFGIRVRETLESEEVWRRVHRFAGRTYVSAGLLSAGCALIGYFSGMKWLELAGLLVFALGGSLIIWVYARRVHAGLQRGEGRK